MAAADNWAVERRSGGAQELHDRPFPSDPRRLVTICDAGSRALVLGSTQKPPASPALEVARRRSGGGAVVVGPGEVVWVDVDLPARDGLWDRDVGRSFWWLGEAWAAALRSLGVDRVDVHHGPVVCTPWCAEVCFAGIGQGEVTIAGRKAIGLSQRRTREVARFHCAALLRWDVEPLVASFGLGDAAARGLAELAAPVGVDAEALVAALAAALPA